MGGVSWPKCHPACPWGYQGKDGLGFLTYAFPPPHPSCKLVRQSIIRFALHKPTTRPAQPALWRAHYPASPALRRAHPAGPACPPPGPTRPAQSALCRAHLACPPRVQPACPGAQSWVPYLFPHCPQTSTRPVPSPQAGIQFSWHTCESSPAAFRPHPARPTS